MADRGVTLQCAACGLSWTVFPKPDGTLPGGARCPKARGGCGKLRKIGRTAVPAAAPAAGWNPPSAPRPERDAAEPCGKCGSAVKTDRRGITRWCPACNMLITPPGVLAPYERGSDVTRAARSQRERDDDAKKTVLIAGEFLRRVRGMLDDPKIHSASADLLGWYDEEITEARRSRDGRRLAELADEFTADREAGAFRRLHWWQGQPAALEATHEGDDYEDDDDGQDDEPAAVTLATPASTAAQPQPAQPRKMTWAEALAACGWRIASATGTCQVIDEHGRHCEAGTGSPPITDQIGRHAWLCQWHYGTLGAAIIETNRSRGVA